MKEYLTKYQYLSFLQCPQSSWLSRNRPANGIPQEGEQQKALASEVKDLARQIFPGGVEITIDTGDSLKKCEQTQELIREGQSVIYDASFIYGEVAFVPYIVQKLGSEIFGGRFPDKKNAYRCHDFSLPKWALFLSRRERESVFK